MNEQLLKLKPKRYLCPYCGQWHDWPDKYKSSLGYYDECYYCVKLPCNNVLHGNWHSFYTFYIQNGHFYYIIESLCHEGAIALESEIAISDITESTEQPTVTFEVPHKPHELIRCQHCFDCCIKKACDLDHTIRNIMLGFYFNKTDYNNFATSPIKSATSK